MNPPVTFSPREDTMLLPSGIYYNLARADATGAVAEASETSNTTTKVITITP